MRTKIVGWLYIIASPIFLVGGFLSLLTINDTFSNPVFSLSLGLGGLLLGIYSFLLGSAIKTYKKWSYKAGLITFSLVALGNLIAAFTSNPTLLLGVVFNIFCIYALLSEKQLFNPPFLQEGPIPTNPT